MVKPIPAATRLQDRVGALETIVIRAGTGLDDLVNLQDTGLSYKVAAVEERIDKLDKQQADTTSAVRKLYDELENVKDKEIRNLQINLSQANKDIERLRDEVDRLIRRLGSGEKDAGPQPTDEPQPSRERSRGRASSRTRERGQDEGSGN